MIKPAKPTKKTNAVGTKKESAVKATTQSASKASAGLRIVDIGASAGRLEALEHLFTNVPSNSVIASVVVRHLDPTQKLLRHLSPLAYRPSSRKH